VKLVLFLIAGTLSALADTGGLAVWTTNRPNAEILLK
jgi:hypothetical protein